MKPRASMPATLSIFMPAHGCTSSSTAGHFRRWSSWQLFLHALREGLPALHLVAGQGFDNLHDDSLGRYVTILRHGLGDVVHQRFFRLVAAAGNEVDGDFGHGLLLLFP